jgi:hypothetical protein
MSRTSIKTIENKYRIKNPLKIIDLDLKKYLKE